MAVAVGAGRGDVWIYELQRPVRRRLTFLESEVIPSAWTANKGVVFTHVDGARLRSLISAQAADGTGTPEKLADGCCGIFSASGTLVFAKENDARDSDSDLYYRGAGEAAPKVLLDRKGSQESPALSPDGSYVAYQSNESGRYEVYVRPFPSGAGQWQISLAGGGEARWSSRGDKLWFRAYGNVLMEVEVKSAGGDVRVRRASRSLQGRSDRRRPDARLRRARQRRALHRRSAHRRSGRLGAQHHGRAELVRRSRRQAVTSPRLLLAVRASLRGTAPAAASERRRESPKATVTSTSLERAAIIGGVVPSKLPLQQIHLRAIHNRRASNFRIAGRSQA